jgi:hypothetical protein
VVQLPFVAAFKSTCDAWNFFARDPDRIASITARSWATVNL